MKSALLILLLLLGVQSTAFAEGGDTSVRGGGKVVKVGNQWKISDIFSGPTLNGGSVTLSTKVKDYFKYFVRPLVETYMGETREEYWSELASDWADYRLVDALPCERLSLSMIDRFPENSHNIGCTTGKTTFLLRNRFSSLDSNTKILVLMHERGHAFDSSDNAHSIWLQPFIKAVALLLEVHTQQSLGHFKRLSGEEVLTLKRLVEGYYIRSVLVKNWKEAYFRKEQAVVVAQGGGLLVLDKKMKPLEINLAINAWIGVGSRYIFTEEVCGDVQHLFNQRSPNLGIVNSVLVDSTVACAQITDSFIKASRISRTEPDQEISTLNIHIHRSKIFLSSIKVNYWLDIEDSVIAYSRLRSESSFSNYIIRSTLYRKEEYLTGDHEHPISQALEAITFVDGQRGPWFKKPKVIDGAFDRILYGSKTREDIVSDSLTENSLLKLRQAEQEAARRDVFFKH